MESSTGRAARAGLFGALVGGMAGFAVGLLLAPEEGSRTRRRLLYQLQHATLQAGLFIEDIMRSQAHPSEARRTSNALVEDAQERAQRIRTDIDALLEEMRRERAAE